MGDAGKNMYGRHVYVYIRELNASHLLTTNMRNEPTSQL